MISSLTKKLILLSLEEDAPSGDVTTQMLIPSKKLGTASIILKQDGIVCGLFLIEEIFSLMNEKVKVLTFAKEGSFQKNGKILAKISGHAAALLQAERVILNFIQRLSGIATSTRSVVAHAPAGLRILDTRKTTPGFRELEKYAVKMGGGSNHRTNLSSAVLVKNNHIDLTKGGMPSVVKKLKRDPYIPLIIEARNLKEVSAALKVQPGSIMLDNMSLKEMKKAVILIRKKSPSTFVEATGNMHEGRFKEVRSIGVDGVSLGKLTHQIASLDISMKIS